MFDIDLIIENLLLCTNSEIQSLKIGSLECVKIGVWIFFEEFSQITRSGFQQCFSLVLKVMINRCVHMSVFFRVLNIIRISKWVNTVIYKITYLETCHPLSISRVQHIGSKDHSPIKIGRSSLASFAKVGAVLLRLNLLVTGFPYIDCNWTSLVHSFICEK